MKNRDCNPDLEFYRIIKKISKHYGYSYRVFPKILIINEISYVTEISNESLDSTSSIENYFVNSGILLCLAYVFQLTDLHHENIIATKDGPVPIDFETLFSDNFETVLDTALLPCYNIFGARIAGFSKSGGTKTTIRNYKIKNEENSSNLVYSDYASFNVQRNHAKKECTILEYFDNIDTVLYGFSKAYQYLQETNLHLNILHKFKKYEYRNLKLKTYDIYKILDVSKNSVYLRNEKFRVLYFAQFLKKLDIQDEEVFGFLDSLYNYTVPAFFFNKSYTDSIALKKLTSEDMYQQIKIIKMAFEFENFDRNEYRNIMKNKEVPVEGKLQEVTDKILDSIITKDGNTWLDLSEQWHNSDAAIIINQVTIMDDSFYNGRSGVLFYLMEVYNNKCYSDLVRLKEVILSVGLDIKSKLFNGEYLLDASIGFYQGVGGIVYSLIKLEQMGMTEDLNKDRIYDVFIDRLKSFNYTDRKNHEAYDLFTGISGAIKSILLILNIEKDQKIVNRFKSELDTLILKLFNVLKREIEDNENVYMGYAHGIMGVLSVMYDIEDKNSTCRQLIKMLEKVLVVSKIGDFFYPKLYLDSEIGSGWCHGVTGQLLFEIKGKNRESYIQEYVNHIVLKDIGYNPSLCHGDVGHLIIVDKAKKYLNFNKYQMQYLQEINRKVFNIDLKVFLGFGLFVGIAGYGMFLLRCCNNSTSDLNIDEGYL